MNWLMLLPAKNLSNRQNGSKRCKLSGIINISDTSVKYLYFSQNFLYLNILLITSEILRSNFWIELMNEGSYSEDHFMREYNCFVLIHWTVGIPHACIDISSGKMYVEISQSWSTVRARMTNYCRLISQVFFI